MARPTPLLLKVTGGVGTPEPSSERGAANPSPPHASQQDHAGPACPHQRACCSPQCRVCCTTETFKHQGNMTFWKGEILIRHLSLIIPPLSEMRCDLSPKASPGTTRCNAIEVNKNECQALFPFPFTRHPLEFLLAIYFYSLLSALVITMSFGFAEAGQLLLWGKGASQQLLC